MRRRLPFSAPRTSRSSLSRQVTPVEGFNAVPRAHQNLILLANPFCSQKGAHWSMSLKPQPIGDVPEDTARVALAVFRKGNPYLTFRNEFGTLYQDADFAALFAVREQPALPPWRLALITLVQFPRTSQ